MGALADPDPPLADGDLGLRGILTVDPDELGRGLTEPDVLGFAYGNRLPADPAEAAGLVRQRSRLMRDEGRGIMLGAFLDGAFAGSTLLFHIDAEDSSAEIGFWVTAGARGRGVASRAVAMTCTWAFETLGLHRIEALTDPDNPPSDRVLERAGFQFEGVRRGADPRPDGFHDSRVWSQLAGDPR